MRNLKKIIAVVVTFVMLLSVACIAASATTEPTLALYGKSETNLTKENTYYELAVHLTDAGNKVGGIEGQITYNSTVFEYYDVVLNSKFVEAGNPDAASVVSCTDNNGVIRFVGLNNSESTGEWFVLRFKVVNTTEAGSPANFALTAQGANTSGYVTVNVVGDSAVVDNDELVNVVGASIKRVDDAAKQDIRFFAEVKPEFLPSGVTVKEYGILLMFTKRLGYRELKVDMIASDEPGLAYASSTQELVADENGDYLYTVNLNNMSEAALGVKISARAYVKLSDDTIVYSKNFDSTYGTKSGYDSKSVIDVARKAALDCEGATPSTIDEINNILAKDSIKGEDRTKLLEYINEFYVAD